MPNLVKFSGKIVNFVLKVIKKFQLKFGEFGLKC